MNNCNIKNIEKRKIKSIVIKKEIFKIERKIIMLLYIFLNILSSVLFLNYGFNFIMFIFVTLVNVILISNCIISKSKYMNSFIIVLGFSYLVLSIIGLTATFTEDNIYEAFIMSLILSPIAYTNSISFVYTLMVGNLYILIGIYNINKNVIKHNKRTVNNEKNCNKKRNLKVTREH